MKKIIPLLVLVLSLAYAKAQTYVTIPDANFAAWLQTNIPSAMNGNQMDIISPAVTTRTTVSVPGLNIADLTGIEYFTSLDTLACNSNQLSSLPNLPVSLKYLFCGGNLLSNLPNLPNTLLYLNCEHTGLSSLPPLPNTLDFLCCNFNQLTSLPILPNSLLKLDCVGNRLSSLPNLPNSLSYLNCSINQLTSLPTLPGSLDTLMFDNNQISSLPTLPSSLISIQCINNLLTTLPNLPGSLTSLFCDNNQLSSLPNLPNSLQMLGCRENLLTNLPVLPNALKGLSCNGNQLNNLPSLPSSLTLLYCADNQLNYISSFPEGLIILDCSYNNLSCFPPFPNHMTTNFNISSNPFTCLPNYIPVMDDATLNYPLCVSGNTLTNPNGCETGKGITGTVFSDLNSDCINNTGDPRIKNGIVKLYNNANVFLGMINTYNNGSYFFNDTSGVYHVVLDTINKPYAVQCINPGVDSLVTLTPTHVLEDSVNFAVTCKPGFDVGVQSINRIGAAFPGLTHTLTVVAGDMSQWNNFVCNNGMAGTVSFSVNGPVDYIGSAAGALTPNITGNVYTYNIADFGTVDNFSDFRLALTTHTNAQIGDFICVNATVTPVNGDNVPANNVLEFCYPVVNSYDPNIKEVYPVTVQPNYNDWLTYTIHFQNTGNAPAVNIRLEDDLDTKLNPETFQVMNYSHNNILDVKGNHLTVRFPNIQLVDSTTNRQGSIGFIQYRIKPNAGWVTDTIENKASIYFDYNAPIITNTAKSYILMPTAVKELYKVNGFDVYPNPTESLLTITSKNDFEKIELSNVTGQILLSETLHTKEHLLQLQNFAEGIYFVKVSYANGSTTTKKVVKQ